MEISNRGVFLYSEENYDGPARKAIHFSMNSKPHYYKFDNAADFVTFVIEIEDE